jgi:hypothetical protein
MLNVVGPFRPDWSDMSPFVVHFTSKSGWGNAETIAAHNLQTILKKRQIEARNAHGAGRQHPASPKVACFSEIPVHQLSRLAERYGEHGLGFHKKLMVEKDGGPVLYAYKGTPHAVAIQEAVDFAKDDPSHPIWKIAPFVASPGHYGDTKYFFEWEREWRVPGDFDFSFPDVAFLIVPEAEHADASKWLRTEIADHEFRLVDPRWGRDRGRIALPRS